MAKWLLTDGTSQTIQILDKPRKDMLPLLQGLVAGLIEIVNLGEGWTMICLLYTSPRPRARG